MTSTRTAKPITSDVIERLKSVVGPTGHISNPTDIAPYCRSFRDGWEGRAALVLRPQSTEEVSKLVRICSDAGVGIVPQGGNTGLTGAGQPHDDLSEVVLSTSRLNRIRETDIVNDTIVVEAGVVLSQIQAAADKVDRLFPLSLGAEGSCQIGGNVSTNAGGVNVLRYGNTRNLVLGLEVVLPDGSVWEGLRGLRKDNTGYDMKQMFIGAEGTLGIVTAAVLRLFPRPIARETAWIGIDSPKAGVDLLGHMRGRLGETVSAFELIGRPIIELLLAGVPGHEDPMSEVHPWYVLVEVTSQGPAGSLHAPLADALAAAFEAGLIRDALIAASGAQAARLWRMRESLVEAQQAAGGALRTTCQFQSHVFRSSSNARTSAVEAACPGFDVVRLVTSATATCTTIRLSRSSGSRSLSRASCAINRVVHDIIADLGGSISAEHGVGRSRLFELEHYKAPVELALMRSIKNALDPLGIHGSGQSSEVEGPTICLRRPVRDPTRLTNYHHHRR